MDVEKGNTEETYNLKFTVTGTYIAIEEFISNHNWGVKEEIHAKCNKCGKEVAEGYNIDPASFFSANNN